jgi:rhodanese-related sulfurtransferase
MKLIRFLHILAVSLALAGYSAWVSEERQRASLEVTPGPEKAIPLIRGDEAEKLWHAGSTVFLDVRSSTDYAFGHIAGAVHMPEEEMEKQLPALRPRLDRATAIVTYCGSENCGKSLWAAIRLRNEGLNRTRIYPAGWKEWQQRGLPSTRTSER